MKVLNINCVYGTGSTGKILRSLHLAMNRQNIDSYVVYGRGLSSNEAHVQKIATELECYAHSVMSRLMGVNFGFSYCATARLCRLLYKEKPDVVHLHCLNGHFVNVYRLLEHLKKNNIPTVITLHAEIMHTAGCEHAFECEKWKTECHDCLCIRGAISQFFRDDARFCFKQIQNCYANFRNLTIVGVSDWLTNRAKGSAAFIDSVPHFTTIHNGVDAAIYTYRQNERTRNKWKIPAGKVILHVTPNFLHPLKGGKYVLQLAEQMPDTTIVIVGYNGKEKLPRNVVPIAHTSNQEELAELYSMADLCLLTSSRETFSMVCAESLCCGTPVLGFMAGGPESIALTECSSFVEYGDMNALVENAKIMLTNHYNKEEISQKAALQYSNDTMCDKYIELYKRISNISLT